MTAGNIIPITDMTAQGLALLIPEYQETPRWQAWISSFLDAAQNLETATADVWAAALDLDGAVGSQLDLVGQLLVEDRDGRTDDDYRRALKVRVLINKSSGTTEQLIQIGDLFADVSGEVGAYIRIQDLQPARIEYRIVRTPVAERGETDKRLRNAKAAGVALQTLLHPGGPGGSFRFSDVTTYPEKDTAQGFARADLTSGGRFADIYQVGGLLFDPSDVSGLVFDGDGDKGITIDTGVSLWEDQSSKGHDAGEANTLRQPACTKNDVDLNWHGALVFDGASSDADRLSMLSDDNDFRITPQGFAVYLVASFDPVTALKEVFSRWSGASFNQYFFRITAAGRLTWSVRNSANTSWQSVTTPVRYDDATPRVIRVGWDPVAGVSHMSVGGADSTISAPTAREDTTIGACRVWAGTPTNAAGGRLARQLRYNRWPTPAEDTAIMTYLNARYGL